MEGEVKSQQDLPPAETPRVVPLGGKKLMLPTSRLCCCLANSLPLHRLLQTGRGWKQLGEVPQLWEGAPLKMYLQLPPPLTGLCCSNLDEFGRI